MPTPSISKRTADFCVSVTAFKLKDAPAVIIFGVVYAKRTASGAETVTETVASAVPFALFAVILAVPGAAP